MNDTAPITFPRHRLQMIAEREHAHFWHAPRTRLLLDTVASSGLCAGGRFLDVGCGSGAMAAALSAAGHDVRGIDPWAGETGLDPGSFITGQAESLTFPDASFSAASAFDVIEHADDERALAELFRVLAPGGRLFLSVPAYDWLWSTRDDLAGHRRRYSRRQLRQKLGHAGFRIERLFGYQFLLLPLFALSRLWSRLARRTDSNGEDHPGPMLNSVLRILNDFEVSAGRWLRPPIGSSLVLVASKPFDQAPR